MRQLCDEALWLDHGVTKAQGNSIYVTNEYTSFQRHQIDETLEVLAGQYESVDVSGKDPAMLPRVVDARQRGSGRRLHPTSPRVLSPHPSVGPD